MTLSFSITNLGRTIEIVCDDEGLDALIGILQDVRKDDGHVLPVPIERRHGSERSDSLG